MKYPFIEDCLRLIRFRSTASHPKELFRAAQWVHTFCAQYKTVTSRIYNHNAVPSIYAQSGGTWMQPTILLQGHIDVVEGKDTDFTPRITKTRIYGRGAADMKASVVLLMHALVNTSTMPHHPSVGLLLTGDEEIGGKNGTEWMTKTHNIRPQCIINLDGGYGEELSYAEKGVLYLRITTHGKSSLATYPWNGDCAATRMSEIIRILNKRFNAQKRANDMDNWVDTCTILHISGGDPRVKRVIDETTLVARIAFTRDITAEHMLHTIKNALPACDVQIIMSAERVYTNPHHRTITHFQRIYADICKKAIPTRGENGTSDARFFTSQHIPIIITKPKSGNPEMDNEWIDIQSCAKLLTTINQFIAKYKI